MRHHQEGKPFWLTEAGWKSTRVGPQTQADYLLSLLRDARARPWLSKVFLFELKDYRCAPGYGLLDLSERPKPAYAVLRDFILSDGAFPVPPQAGRRGRMTR